MDVIPGATRKTGQKQLPSDSRFERGTETKKKRQRMIVGEISQNLTVI